MSNTLEDIFQKFAKLNDKTGQYLNLAGTEKWVRRAKLVSSNLTMDKVRELYKKHANSPQGMNLANFRKFAEELFHASGLANDESMKKLLSADANSMLQNLFACFK